MKTFHCTHCESLVFFENVRCLTCEHPLAFLPDEGAIVALEQSEGGFWRVDGKGATDRRYRLCDNYDRENVCNWAVPADDPETLCRSCRLTRVIPTLSIPENRIAWFRLEQAKRRMVYTLLAVGLPLARKLQDEDSGLAFEFLQEGQGGDAARVLTGHDNGLITVNVAEADDVHRERQRTLQHEPYRTLLGHFRHEIGHYYWGRLILDSPRLEGFRQLFGDERANYQESLKVHYEKGPPEGWDRQYISAYATTHPWEDWAESWAHYLHMVDTLEWAGSAGLSLKPRRSNEPAMRAPSDPLTAGPSDFEAMIAAWFPLTYVLNSLNRGLGLPDAYPFLLLPPVIQKLQFIHETIEQSRQR
jgi:hypothetical protein